MQIVDAATPQRLERGADVSNLLVGQQVKHPHHLPPGGRELHEQFGHL